LQRWCGAKPSAVSILRWFQPTRKRHPGKEGPLEASCPPPVPIRTNSWLFLYRDVALRTERNNTPASPQRQASTEGPRSAVPEPRLTIDALDQLGFAGEKFSGAQRKTEFYESVLKKLERPRHSAVVENKVPIACLLSLAISPLHSLKSRSCVQYCKLGDSGQTTEEHHDHQELERGARISEGARGVGVLHFVRD
jgi:hypothetical protein